VDGKYNRGSAKGELVAQNAAGSLRYDYYLSRQLYVLGNQLFEYDLFQNLAIRSSTMAGLGYDLFDHKSHLLTFGAGPAAVYQNFTTEPDTLSPSAMWLVRWYREFRGGDLRLFHHHQGFQDVGASRAFRLNADQGIRVKIFGDFSLNLEYDLRFNTEPAPGRKELDQAFIFGVAYEIER
jgi:putative salt-induced outer membrane protein YdiY